MRYEAPEGKVYANKLNASSYFKIADLGINDSIDNYILIDEPLLINGEIWHENKLFQVKLSYDDQLTLLEQYPEMGVYRKQNNIIVYKENDTTYFYVNYILDQHKALLLSFNATITENSTNQII